MAECKYTCFDRVMHLVKPLPEDKIEEAIDITLEDGLSDFIDFLVENDCCTEAQGLTLYEGIVMWEDLDGNYWEEDFDKYHELQEKAGLSRERVEAYMDKAREDEKEEER